MNYCILAPQFINDNPSHEVGPEPCLSSSSSWAWCCGLGAVQAILRAVRAAMHIIMLPGVWDWTFAIRLLKHFHSFDRLWNFDYSFIRKVACIFSIYFVIVMVEDPVSTFHWNICTLLKCTVCQANSQVQQKFNGVEKYMSGQMLSVGHNEVISLSSCFRIQTV